MKKFVENSLLSILLVISLQASASEISGSHGGDPCEDTFQKITRELRAFVMSDSVYTLNFRNGDTQESFSRAMVWPIIGYLERTETKSVLVSCVRDKILVDSAEKTCAWRSPKDDPTITDGNIHLDCNFDRFYRGIGAGSSDEISADDLQSFQYKQVIHEWASIAGLEKNSGGVSDYFYTDQITAKGKWVHEYHLGVHDVQSGETPGVSFTEKTEHSDGSVTFSLPGITYGGRLYPIAFEFHPPHEKSFDATCRALGFAKTKNNASSGNQFGNEMGPAVSLTNSGLPRGLLFSSFAVTKVSCVK